MTSQGDELITGLQNGTLELAIMVPPASDQTQASSSKCYAPPYPLCVAMTLRFLLLG